MKNSKNIFLILVGIFLIAEGGETLAQPRRRGQVPSVPSESHSLCRPEGRGPFPAVIYNHGGKGNIIGGAPRETCEALAEIGFVGYAPIRRQTVSLEGHLDDVLAAVDYVKTLPYVDPNRLGIMGFSRGGLLTLEVAIRKANDFKAVILMAPAPGGEENLEKLLLEIGRVSAPVLILVAQNDTGQQVNHVALSQKVLRALQEKGKEAKLILYPPDGNDGHRMFLEIGSYWQDIKEFLKTHAH